MLLAEIVTETTIFGLSPQSAVIIATALLVCVILAIITLVKKP